MTLRETTIGFACTFLVAAAGCTKSDSAGQRSIGPESVVVSLPEQLGALERPAVAFDHATHVKALEKCETCHAEGKEGQLSLRTVRLDENSKRGGVMDAYHEQCRGCHAKRAKEKLSTGPLMCGDCHVRGTPVSAQRQIAFADLHDIHIEVAENNCGTCHHYSSGTNPPACKSCHARTTTAGDKPSSREAYHRKCIGCHRTMGVEAGCAQCHDKASKEVQL